MKYSKVGFREVYKKFCLFDMTDTFRRALREFPGVREANAVLTYGYIDHQAGLTVEILCACKKDGEDISIAQGNDEVRSFVRIGAIEDVRFEHIDERIAARFEKKLKTVSRYESDGNEGLRDRKDLDHLREYYNPDDVMVILRKKGKEKGECVRVRLEGITEMFVIGELLDESYKEYGYHEHDMVCMREVDMDGKISLFLDERSPENDYGIVCNAEFDDLREAESEKLLGEQLFEKVVKVYLEDPSEKNFAQLFAFLSTDTLWVPMAAHISGSDEEVNLKPDILENSGRFFFPIFTAEWVIVKEYAKGFSIIPMKLRQVLEYTLLYDEKELSGIVINAFTSPVEFPIDVVKRMLEILVNMREDGISE